MRRHAFSDSVTFLTRIPKLLCELDLCLGWISNQGLFFNAWAKSLGMRADAADTSVRATVDSQTCSTWEFKSIDVGPVDCVAPIGGGLLPREAIADKRV